MEITEELTLHNIPNPRREAELLLMHYYAKDALWIITNQHTQLSRAAELEQIVAQRAKNIPLEYITKRVSFYSKEFFIDYGALIPRPETELLIDEVKKEYKKPHAKITFVEVGVGSGIISIILALFFPHARFIAVDISQDALAIARINIEKFGVQDRIELRCGSLLEPIDEPFDYLVSNPPYIAKSAPLESNLSYEPQNALFGGEVGDEIIQELLREVLKRKIKFFTCEIGYDQKDRIANFLKDQRFEKLKFYRDLSGFDRGFTLRI